MLPPCFTLLFSALKMEAARSSETSVNVYQTIMRHNPKDGNLHSHLRENLKKVVCRYSVLTLSSTLLPPHGIAQSVQRRATGWTAGDRFLAVARDFSVLHKF
jgi:hypothetical protein